MIFKRFIATDKNENLKHFWFIFLIAVYFALAY